MPSAEMDTQENEIIIQLSRKEIQAIAQKQFGRPLSEDELIALNDLSPIALHDWISLAIEAAQIEPSPH